MRGFVSKLAGYLLPVAAVAAMGLISYGAYLVYSPAGYIVGGVLLLLAVFDARR
jgi:hypothetical protein